MTDIEDRLNDIERMLKTIIIMLTVSPPKNVGLSRLEQKLLEGAE